MVCSRRSREQPPPRMHSQENLPRLPIQCRPSLCFNVFVSVCTTGYEESIVVSLARSLCTHKKVGTGKPRLSFFSRCPTWHTNLLTFFDGIESQKSQKTYSLFPPEVQQQQDGKEHYQARHDRGVVVSVDIPFLYIIFYCLCDSFPQGILRVVIQQFLGFGVCVGSMLRHSVHGINLEHKESLLPQVHDRPHHRCSQFHNHERKMNERFASAEQRTKVDYPLFVGQWCVGA